MGLPAANPVRSRVFGNCPVVDWDGALHVEHEMKSVRGVENAAQGFAAGGYGFPPGYRAFQGFVRERPSTSRMPGGPA